MSLILPENPGTSSQPEPSAPRLSWIDVVLLVVVLGALVTLLALGTDLPEAVAVVGVAGLVSAEMRRRFTQS
ncbi:hypothetical protein [Streptomyces asiaticus]